LKILLPISRAFEGGIPKKIQSIPFFWGLALTFLGYNAFVNLGSEFRKKKTALRDFRKEVRWISYANNLLVFG